MFCVEKEDRGTKKKEEKVLTDGRKEEEEIKRYEQSKREKMRLRKERMKKEEGQKKGEKENIKNFFCCFGTSKLKTSCFGTRT